MNNLDAAWLAGFVDGEGYIGIVKHKPEQRHQIKQGTLDWYSPRVQIAGTNYNVMESVKDMIGKATISTYLRPQSKWKDSIQVMVVALGDIQRLLSSILPYLRLKQKQADLLLEYIKLRFAAPDHAGWGKTSYGPREIAIYGELQILNKKGRVQ